MGSKNPGRLAAGIMLVLSPGVASLAQTHGNGLAPAAALIAQLGVDVERRGRPGRPEPQRGNEPETRVKPVPEVPGRRPSLRRPGQSPGLDVTRETDAVTEPEFGAGSPRRPGYDSRREVMPVGPWIDPNRRSGLAPVQPAAAMQAAEPVPVLDRWRLAGDLGLVRESWLNPYGRNLLKADRPFYRDWFISLGLVSDTLVEARRVPTPVAPQIGAADGALDIFGSDDQSLINQNLAIPLVVYKGDTVFRPPDFEFRITPVLNYNRSEVEELRVLNISPRSGTTREDSHVGLQEFFVDVHLRNVSDRYDFDSLRVGIQPFNTDFRGFLFQDSPFGIRLFGTRDNNIWQYNLAWFRRLEKNTNSGLNDAGQRLRDDDLLILNLYRQDFPSRGFTSQISLVHNRNREDESLYFDDNGLLVRPASIGTERLRRYDLTYLGYNGDGHFGRLNLSLSTYYAFGEESVASFDARSARIESWFGAAELSMDFDWLRLRLSTLYARGDSDPYDGRSEGFDAVLENPVFAGADASYWIRQAVPYIGGGGVALSGRNGVLASLRSSRDQGQSNFTNPGLQLLGVGADLDLTPRLRLSGDLNQLYFDDTSSLEAARNQAPIDPEIGLDASMALIYRPLMSQNIVLRLSVATLIAGRGFEALYGDDPGYSVLGNLVLAY